MNQFCNTQKPDDALNSDFSNDESVTSSENGAQNYNKVSDTDNNKMLKILIMSASHKMDDNIERCFNRYRNILNFIKANDNSESLKFDDNIDWKTIYAKLENCYSDYLLFNEMYVQTGRYGEEFEEMSQLGCGGFGTVCKAVHKFNGNAYAIKTIPIQDGGECMKLFKELKIFANLNSDYIVHYYSAWIESNNNQEFGKDNANDFNTIERPFTKSSDNDCCHSLSKGVLYIQMELCSSTLRDTMDLLNAELNQNKLTFLTSIGYYIASELFIEILESVDYLHKLDNPVIHRDLKPENILITDGSNGRFVKIADFGLSTLHEMDKQTHTQGMGTLKYMAPEVLNCRKYNTKADVYSLGVIMKELFHLDINLSTDLSIIETGPELEVERLKYVSAGVIHYNMTSTSSSLRPSCEQIILNKYLWTLSFEELLTDKSVSGFVNQMKNECKSEQISDKFYINFMRQRLSRNGMHSNASNQSSVAVMPSLSKSILKDDNFGIVDVSNYMIKIFENIRKEQSRAFDPLVMDESIMELFKSEKFGHSVTLNIESGSKIMGISNIAIKKFKALINLNEFKLNVTADVTLDELRNTGKYELIGNVFRFFPIKGNGMLSIELKNITGELRITGCFDDYLMKIESLDMDMSFSSIAMYFENLVDSKLSPFLNGLINFLAKPVVDILVLKNQSNREKIN